MHATEKHRDIVSWFMIQPILLLPEETTWVGMFVNAPAKAALCLPVTVSCCRNTAH